MFKSIYQTRFLDSFLCQYVFNFTLIKFQFFIDALFCSLQVLSIYSKLKICCLVKSYLFVQYYFPLILWESKFQPAKNILSDLESMRDHQIVLKLRHFFYSESAAKSFQTDAHKSINY